VHVYGGSGAGATMAPEGKDNIKDEACLGCKRNVLLPLTQSGDTSIAAAIASVLPDGRLVRPQKGGPRALLHRTAGPPQWGIFSVNSMTRFRGVVRLWSSSRSPGRSCAALMFWSLSNRGMRQL
jgi:hypothetical protein